MTTYFARCHACRSPLTLGRIAKYVDGYPYMLCAACEAVQFEKP